MSLTTTHQYLKSLYGFQQRIALVYRENQKSNWSDRCFYLDDCYDQVKRYTHRSILQCEVVIEFDDDSIEKNKKLADEVRRRLHKDNISCAMFYSGNKSYHLHTVWDFKEAKNIPLLKNTIMRHYTVGLQLPDLRLAAENHLIRCEFGFHEKTGRQKSLVRKDSSYPCLGEVPVSVWDEYANRQKISVTQRMTRQVNSLIDHPGLKWILTSEEFRAANDGRERALFLLIHVLKPEYVGRKEELIKFLITWHRYSSQKPCFSDAYIRNKVNYHFNKTYTFGTRFLNELLEELGREDLIQK